MGVSRPGVLALIALSLAASGARADTRVEIRSYIAGIEFVTVCQTTPSSGGACFDVRPGERSLEIEIEDERETPTGGSYQFKDAAGNRLLKFQPGFCDVSGSVEIPDGTVQLVVDVEEVFPLGPQGTITDCRDIDSSATRGIISVTFSTDPVGPPPPPTPPPVPLVGNSWTVVAVVDSGFSPYHYDFLGHQHPRNRDSNPGNDFDFWTDPATYIDGYPGATPLPITVPTSPVTDVEHLAEGPDAAVWAEFRVSTPAEIHMYRFPGTKIIGALSFEGDFVVKTEGNYAHGTRAAAVAAGTWHGTCPECLFVLIKGETPEALAWAASQPWIDVVTNSYGHGIVGGYVRDNFYLDAPLGPTKAGVESGQTIVFSAGNGLVNMFDVPTPTYWSSEKGPDWITTVGAVSPSSRQTYTGAGKPVDISSIGKAYPSTGGEIAAGPGYFGGTSNAAPVVAGTFAKVIQMARDAMGDSTETHSDGVVASGAPVPCGPSNPACVLGDGVLTRRELDDVVYGTVVPSQPALELDTIVPTTPFAYVYQGHGMVLGHGGTQAEFEAEQQRLRDALFGDAVPSARPAGETNWFIVDSKCRQRLWGAWDDGLYSGTEPDLDPAEDPIALAFSAWCSPLPDGLLTQIADAT